MLQLTLQIFGWIGVIVAMSVAVVAVLAVFMALIYAAISPVFPEIDAWLRDRKIKRASAHYAGRFPGGKA